ncbi:hypothetical protein [Fusobacterium sp. SYSU M8D902]|uniref:hypothetical protein n=1 Tax=Fusobacterium sp. SYSU M8D902 TaxID=3159562 RepID=UPI0032E3D8C7
MQKILKYIILIVGTIFGLMSIKNKKGLCYLKEAKLIIFSNLGILGISLLLILVNGGNIKYTFELSFRFMITILYSFVILNIFNLDEIYKLMIYLLFVSILGWILEKGVNILSISNIKSISFFNSFSPFETHYFAASSINCCTFFMYYRKNKIISIISFIFVLLTFKRPAIVFSIILFLLPLFINIDKRINKMIILIGKIMCITVTILWFYLLLSENSDIFFTIVNDIPEHFTQGRSTILNLVLDTGYKAAGLGSTNSITWHGIEMDLIQFLLETTIFGLIIIINTNISIAGRKLYSFIFMTFNMVTCLTGSSMYNIFGWIPIYIIYGCINYKKSEKLKMKFPLIQRREKRYAK